MPQADRLFWGQTLIALLHHLEKKSKIIVVIIIIFSPQIILCCEVCYFTSLKSLCSMNIVLVNGTVWLPLASLAGKSGTFTPDWSRRGQHEDSPTESEYSGYYKSCHTVCGFRSCVQTFKSAGKLVMVTLSGSRTAMTLGAVSFRYSLTHASRRWGSVVVWETVTPTCQRTQPIITQQHSSWTSSYWVLPPFCIPGHKSC